MGALPDWCDPLLDAQQMRAVDRWAIDECGVPSLELMERAGTGVAIELERLAPDGPIAVICGKGNNGGDGLVVARLLRERAREVSVICACDPAELSGDALANLQRLPGERPLRLSQPAAERALGRATAIVDALLGTGFQGSPHGELAEAIAAVNRASASAVGATAGAAAGAALASGAASALATAGATVVSVDVPSGVDASSGMVAAEAVRARLTASFHAAKPGLWVHPGKAHAGVLRTIDIGIPRGAPQRASSGLIDRRVLDLLPSRSALSTKFTSGHVAIAGGSPGLMGAPALAALAAMRAGAGYVTAYVPGSQAQILDVQLLEAMTRSLPDEHGSLTAQSVDAVLDALARADALVLGPGLGRAPGALSFARALAARAPLPTLIDADGLNAHAGRLGDLRARSAATVLTPHAGELARLLELDGAEIERARLQHVRAASERSGAVVVLKGDDTLIAAPDGRLAVSPGQAPGLATAGSGDVLSGAIAALLAQGLDAFSAAAAGVFLHVLAGRLAARRRGGPDSVIASDVIAALAQARRGAGDGGAGDGRVGDGPAGDGRAGDGGDGE